MNFQVQGDPIPLQTKAMDSAVRVPRDLGARIVEVKTPPMCPT
jgi:hypothetical protein